MGRAKKMTLKMKSELICLREDMVIERDEFRKKTGRYNGVEFGVRGEGSRGVRN
jgi:hypothetical protein